MPRKKRAAAAAASAPTSQDPAELAARVAELEAQLKKVTRRALLGEHQSWDDEELLAAHDTAVRQFEREEEFPHDDEDRGRPPFAPWIAPMTERCRRSPVSSSSVSWRLKPRISDSAAITRSRKSPVVSVASGNGAETVLSSRRRSLEFWRGAAEGAGWREIFHSAAASAAETKDSNVHDRASDIAPSG